MTKKVSVQHGEGSYFQSEIVLSANVKSLRAEIESHYLAVPPPITLVPHLITSSAKIYELHVDYISLLQASYLNF